MIRIATVLFLLTLTACAAPQNLRAPEPLIEEDPAASIQSGPCAPGGDGIGGTGCPVN